MSRYHIVTLIGSSSLNGNDLRGEGMLQTLRQLRSDLFGPDRPLIDFHGDRYVVLFEGDDELDALAWAEGHGVVLHGKIANRADIYTLYLGWTGLIDRGLDAQPDPGWRVPQH
ncbi:hypothetical protein [Jeongeupia chitinilytica]|uniref:Uncharacterized protein n=1 Tax=Jeongeupia chitinilytica TaxID=1041641 RepID=A0ABQ3GZ69_9NEIS|nr:hypothetical protein [Jeongeupia chitinilytica]GHD62222.1 hypothetical protein GCM10007350_17850 [Jeongeupia chitinilytica]